MGNENVRILVTAKDQASAVLGQLATKLSQLGKSSSELDKRAASLAVRMREAGSTFKDVDKQALILAKHQLESKSSLDQLINSTDKAEKETNELAKAQVNLGGSLTATITKTVLLATVLRFGIQGATQAIRGSIAAATEYQTKLLGLTTITNNFGISQKETQSAIQSLTKDGLLNQSQAATALTNIFSSYVTDVGQAVTLIEQFKDFAASGGKASIDFGDKVLNLSEAFLTEMSIMGNNAGLQENWNEIIKVGEQVTGQKFKAVSKLDKQLIKLAGITQIHARAQGAANQFMDTGIGRVAIMRTNMNNLSIELGGALIPAMGQLAAAFNTSTSGGQVLTQAIRSVGVIALGVVMIIRSLAITVATLFRTATVAMESGLNAAVIEFGRGAEEMTNVMADLQGDIERTWAGEVKETLNDVFGSMPEFAKEAADGTAKQMKRLSEQLRKEQESFARATEQMARDFRRSLSDLVFAHRGKVEEIKKGLREETREFESQNAKRVKDFENTMLKLEKAHLRKVRDLNEDIVEEDERHALAREKIEADIREEEKKGIILFGQFNSQANQARLSDLKARLSEEDNEHSKRLAKINQRQSDENEDFADASEERQEKFKEETVKASEEHSKRKTDFESSLSEEEAILERHAELISSIKDIQKENDIERLIRLNSEQKAEAERAHKERIVDLAKQANEAGTTFGAGFKAPVIKAAEETTAEFGENMSRLVEDTKVKAEQAGKGWIQRFIEGVVNKAREFNEKAPAAFRTIFPNISAVNDLSKMIGGKSLFEHGGVIPGSPGEAVPIIAHAGERVIPRTGVDVNASSGGGGLTINMNGPVSMSNERDIQILADKIIRVIGRRNELERLGVGS